MLEPSEAEDARDALQGILERSTGGSDGYQIRIPDVAVHHPLFGELLVHPVILVMLDASLVYSDDESSSLSEVTSVVTLDVQPGPATHCCRRWITRDLAGM